MDARVRSDGGRMRCECPPLRAPPLLLHRSLVPVGSLGVAAVWRWSPAARIWRLELDYRYRRRGCCTRMLRHRTHPWEICESASPELGMNRDGGATPDNHVVDRRPAGMACRRKSCCNCKVSNVTDTRLDTSGRTPALESTVTCPECGTATRMHMPVDACQFFWDCPSCGAVLRPKSGDCCVFCSYGDVPCPPKQTRSNCC